MFRYKSLFPAEGLLGHCTLGGCRPQITAVPPERKQTQSCQHLLSESFWEPQAQTQHSTERMFQEQSRPVIPGKYLKKSRSAPEHVPYPPWLKVGAASQNPLKHLSVHVCKHTFTQCEAQISHSRLQIHVPVDLCTYVYTWTPG